MPPDELMSLARRIALRWAFKYVPKETKEHKVERVREILRDRTGISKTQAEAIADAFVRGREVERLALQKQWPIDNGIVQGPKGNFALNDLPVL